MILFRESMYHVPIGKVKTILDRYSQFLTDDGVFIVRLYLAGPQGKKRYRPRAVIRIIENDFEVVEKAENKDLYATTITVFRPRLRTVKTQIEFASKGTARVAASS